MSKWKLTQWCVHATDQILYPPDHDAVQSELRDHMEDKFDHYLALGLSEEEAVARSLSDMGDAAELAPVLGQIHRPFWGYAYTVSKWLMRITVAAMLLLCIRFAVNSSLLISRVNHPEFYPLDEPYVETDHITRTLVYHTKPEDTAYSDGYFFSIPQAALWTIEDKESNTSSAYFCLQLKATYLPWMEHAEVGRWFWAEDSLGNRYDAFFENYLTEDSYLSSNYYRTGLFTYTYNMWFCNYVSQDAQWIDLHYDRSGRNIVLRIDLTGGDGA